MQEKKNKQRLILLIVLTLLTGGVYWFTMREEKSVVDKDHFKNFDLKATDEITLRSKMDTVELAVENGKWLVNKQYVANREMIDVLFATIMAAEPRRPVSAAMNDSVYQSLEDLGVRVTLSAAGKPQAEMLVGGNSGKSQAYFALPAERRVYIMAIPGYRVYVSGIFESPEAGWRTTRVFDFNWENFQELTAAFPKKEGDFTVVMKDFQITIPGVSPVDTAKLNSFLDAVSLLTVDQYLDKDASLDSLLLLKPIETLTVNDIAGRSHSLSIYPYNRDGVAGLINQKDWALFDRRKVSLITQPKEFFRGK
jgi:hypothetical protein